MPESEQEDSTIYKVVVNHEEQYSIWRAHRPNPSGWMDCGVQGTKAECLAHIDHVWTDMRPLSLRKRMAADAEERRQPTLSIEVEDDSGPDPLVQRLSSGSHPVLASRCDGSLQVFRECVGRGYVHVRFMETGTELGIRLDEGAKTRLAAALAKDSGPGEITGTLTLNDVPVRCVATIEFGSLEGTGRLELAG